jgi:hypothetical protein
LFFILLGTGRTEMTDLLAGLEAVEYGMGKISIE